MNNPLVLVMDGWIRQIAVPESTDPFERAFAREMMEGERLRMKILALFFCFGFAGLAAYAFLFDDPYLKGMIPSVGVITIAGLLYELSARALIRRILSAQRQIPSFARYGNAFLETSLPTLLMVVLCTAIQPVYVLTGPIHLSYAVLILLAVLRVDFWLCAFTGAVACAEYLLLTFVYMDRSISASVDPALMMLAPYLFRAAFFIAMGVTAGLVSLQIKKQFMKALQTVEERNRIVNLFGQHVSPAVVEKLLAQKDGEHSEMKYVCLMFLDIRDFTAFSEKTTPNEVVRYLNSLFEFMIESINRNNGMINKFLGDGFMAVFGAPLSNGLDVHNAVIAAREILDKVKELNNAKVIPPTRIGIGLHAGEAITGNVGSAIRKEYTIIGDTVNLASRVEQLNKQFQSQLLVSETVWRAINSFGYDAEALGSVSVKGKQESVRVYKLA